MHTVLVGRRACWRIVPRPSLLAVVTEGSKSDSFGGSRYSFDPDTIDRESSHGIMLELVGRNRDVLDVGCASGELARAMRRRGCRVSGIEGDAVAAEAAQSELEFLVVGDLEEMDLADALEGRTFDVIVFGDVLEHLRDPTAVLRQAPGIVRPGGSVVLSIPNIAHASVRLALLRGDFTYRPLGLLDETHVRFFTRSSVLALLDEAGLVPVDMRRTVLGPFDTEIQLRPEDVPEDVLEFVMTDPDATTYQFILEAVVDDADGRARRREFERRSAQEENAKLRARLDDAEQEVLRLEAVEAELDRTRMEVSRLQQEIDEMVATEAHRSEQLSAAELAASDKETELADARRELSRAQAEVEATRAEIAATRSELAAIRGSTSWRVSAPIRKLGPLRSALQGPVSQRRSLRRRGTVKATATHLRTHGARNTVRRLRSEIDTSDAKDRYAKWIERHDTLSEQDLEAIHRHIDGELVDGPTFSVVVPVWNTDPTLLADAIGSVQSQLYRRWELVICDDGSTSDATLQLLDELRAKDARITVLRRPANGGIAAATNDALDAASGEFIAFLDHDDALASHALYAMAVEIVRHPDATLLYSDEDKLDWAGRRHDPHFKSDYNPELLLGQNYINHLMVARRNLIDRIGRLDVTLDGSQDHDLVLRLTAGSEPGQVRHVPLVLYHWRQWAGSSTFSSLHLDRAATFSRLAAKRHLAHIGQHAASVSPAPGRSQWNRIHRPVPAPVPAVTAVIPTRDRLPMLRNCVRGLLDHTSYDNLRVLILDNDSSEPATLEWLQQAADDPRVNVLKVPGPFNYSAINNAGAGIVDTPLMILLNNDVAMRDPSWLTEMVGLIQMDGVGAVGAKLLYADGRIQHGGVVLGLGGVAGHSHKHFPGDHPGYFGRLALSQDVSAVTAACLLTKTALFLELGGLDEDNLTVAFNDVDLCLRIREAGHRIVWTPHAQLDHLESASRGPEQSPQQIRRFNSEIEYMRRRWGDVLDSDPFYNPNLTDAREDFTLADQPRVTKPWENYLTSR